MSKDTPGENHREEDPGNDRIARLAKAVTELLGSHPDGGKDLRGIVMLHDVEGNNGTGAFGYDGDFGLNVASDFIKFAGQLLAVPGIRMTVRFRNADGSEEEISPGDYHSPLEQSEPGQPEAELVISGMAPDARMNEACRIVTTALSENDLLHESRIIIMLGLEGTQGVLLHHGYGDDTHAVVHTLLAALMEADDGGHVIPIPMGGHPN